MTYEALIEEIKTLPEAEILKLELYLSTLKLKLQAKETNDDDFEFALKKWRDDSKELFENEAQFMENAFQLPISDETFSRRNIWE